MPWATSVLESAQCQSSVEQAAVPPPTSVLESAAVPPPTSVLESAAGSSPTTLAAAAATAAATAGQEKEKAALPLKEVHVKALAATPEGFLAVVAGAPLAAEVPVEEIGSADVPVEVPVDARDLLEAEVEAEDCGRTGTEAFRP